MQNDSDNKEQRSFFVREWFKHVADDELNACAILKHRDGTPAQVCFLSQQIAEKSLKALLLHYTGDYPKVHGLPQLAVMAGEHVTDAARQLEDDTTLLNPYYVGTRYVADIPLESFTWPMAEEAFAAAMRVKEFVLGKVALGDVDTESGIGRVWILIVLGAAILVGTFG